MGQGTFITKKKGERTTRGGKIRTGHNSIVQHIHLDIIYLAFCS
jgi:hypothetical protein